jgi:hypothetical protein
LKKKLNIKLNFGEGGGIKMAEKSLHIWHGEPEKKIWYIVLFQKKYVEKGTTTSKSRKETIFHENVPPPLPKNLLYKGFFAKN